MGGPIDRIAANADARALADCPARELPDRLVSERAAAGNHADRPFLVNVAGRNADAAATIRVPAFAWCDNAGAVRANQPCPDALHGAFHLHHVVHLYPFGDADDQLESRV